MNTAVGCLFLLQRLFLTQGSNPCLLHLLHWQADSLPLSHLGVLGNISRRVSSILLKRSSWHICRESRVQQESLVRNRLVTGDQVREESEGVHGDGESTELIYQLIRCGRRWEKRGGKHHWWVWGLSNQVSCDGWHWEEEKAPQERIKREGYK